MTNAKLGTAPGMSDPLVVDVWSDIGCPWCYLGKHRLTQAIKGMQVSESISIRTRSFELDPHASTTPVSNLAHLAHKYSLTSDQVSQMENRVVGLAHADGLAYVADRPHANSFDVHRVAHLARTHGVGEELYDALQTALFARAENVYDHAVLVEHAERLGVPGARVSEVLASDEFGEDVRRDEQEAVRLGVTGVPFAVIGGRVAIPGATSIENYQRAIGQVLSASTAL